MDSNKHVEVLSMTVETDEGPREFDYIYCEGYSVTGDDIKNGFVIVLSPLSEAVSFEEAKRLHKADKFCFCRLFDTVAYYPVPGAVDFLTSICDKYHTKIVFDVFSLDSATNTGECSFDTEIICSKVSLP